MQTHNGAMRAVMKVIDKWEPSRLKLYKLARFENEAKRSRALSSAVWMDMRLDTVVRENVPLKTLLLLAFELVAWDSVGMLIDNMKLEDDVDPESLEDQVFTYLAELRDSGQTNMFGAAPYLQREFGIDKREAKALLIKWMESFSAKEQ